MPSRELLLDGSYSTDTKGQTTAARRFLVDVQALAAALADPLIPPLGSAHPAAPSMTCDRLDGQPAVDGTWYITALYSTNGAHTGRGFTPDKAAIGYYQWRPWKARVKLQVPAYAREWQLIPLPGGGQQETRVFRPRYRDVQQERGGFEVEVSVAKLDVPRLQTLIRKCDKLHHINGLWWHFTFEFSGHASATRDNLIYRWQLDEGTPANTLDDSDPDISVPTVEREPWGEWVPIVGRDPTVKPTYKTVQTKTADANGWRDLEGMPPV